MIIKNGLVFTEENKFLPLSVVTEGEKLLLWFQGMMFCQRQKRMNL